MAEKTEIDSLIEQGKYAEAMAILEPKADKTAIDYANLAGLYFMTEQIDKTFPLFIDAIAKYPVSENVSLNLYQAHLCKGQETLAFEEYRRFLKAGGKPEKYNLMMESIEGKRFKTYLQEFYGPEIDEEYGLGG